MSARQVEKKQAIWRLYFVFMVILSLLSIIAWKVLDLQIINNETLQIQGDARTVRNDEIAAHRGNILDRNGQPLAISTPVQSLVLNPKEILQYPEQWDQLAAAMLTIDVNPEVLHNRIQENTSREFMFVKRRIPPLEADQVLQYGFNGVWAEEEYKRYYPLGEVAVHVVGMANSDEVGQEGIELAYDDWLEGTPGSKQVLKDRNGAIISEVRINEVAEPGNDLVLSIDSQIQFLAYKALKEEVTRRYANAGTAVVLNVETGEILAMVSQPSFNPNNRANLSQQLDGLKNRAIAESLEPGSTVKTFTVTAALETGLFDTESIIDTGPGYIRIDRSTIRDPVNYGESTLQRILSKSSQVGATRIALEMGQEPMLDILKRVGFGQSLGTGFPGESAGLLVNHNRWSNSEIATLAYGYGFQVSPLQLAQAYMVYANGGIFKPVSLLKVEDSDEVLGVRVISEELTASVTQMLEAVVTPGGGGTGTRAYIPTHRVAGKTGTAWFYDVQGGGYDDENYISLFAGFAPVSDPKIVTVVTIHEPQGEEYGGGQVAAPVFANITAGALRILNVPPDIISNASENLSLNEFNSTGRRASLARSSGGGQ
ncbi:MAG: penicillin-binding protein 2 [Gammaproteobacteria bacterium]|jgi:cell division protein FtsI (penicillin-binding protein 3)|nr:penicillin-binding protein 2 [Gammaproteobacteria bacterium]